MNLFDAAVYIIAFIAVIAGFYSGFLRSAVTILAEADDDVKSYDMVWLLHLVGDVHQPLHATSRFSAASPQGDCIGSHAPRPLSLGALGRAPWRTLQGLVVSVHHERIAPH